MFCQNSSPVSNDGCVHHMHLDGCADMLNVGNACNSDWEMHFLYGDYDYYLAETLLLS